MSSIGELIRNARQKKKLSQEELANAIGLTKSAISRYESGKRKPEFDQIRRIANVLDVTVSYLLGWDTANDRLHNAGLSIDDLAAELGITRQTLFDVLNSGSPEATSKIIRAATLLADEMEGQKAAIINQVLGRLKSLSTPIERVTHDMSQMTQEGQEKVADYAADILPRYRASPTPQPPTPSSEGTDTTPPTDAPETPSEGK